MQKGTSKINCDIVTMQRGLPRCNVASSYALVAIAVLCDDTMSRYDVCALFPGALELAFFTWDLASKQ